MGCVGGLIIANISVNDFFKIKFPFFPLVSCCFTAFYIDGDFQAKIIFAFYFGMCFNVKRGISHPYFGTTLLVTEQYDFDL